MYTCCPASLTLASYDITGGDSLPLVDVDFVEVGIDSSDVVAMIDDDVFAVSPKDLSCVDDCAIHNWVYGLT